MMMMMNVLPDVPVPLSIVRNYFTYLLLDVITHQNKNRTFFVVLFYCHEFTTYFM